ncbi:hypothetical protein ACLMJK_006766 [Lecanora helva]
MSSFFNRMRSSAGASSPSNGLSAAKKDPNALQITPLEKYLLDAPPGPLRENGSDKFWGLENFGNTCYCNSILQCLYYSVPFREQVINYPKRTPIESVTTTSAGQPRITPDATILPPNHPSLTPAKLMKQQPPTQNSARNPGGPPQTPKPEDKEHPDFKKRVAQVRGPKISMGDDNAAAYGMEESLFTSLKDIFEALLAHKSNVGVVSPTKFLEVLRRENEMFRTAMHQDAHEFLNLLLNEVVANVEVHSKKLEEESKKPTDGPSEKTGFEQALASAMPKALPGNTGWVHELFEGTLTSETKCLTCENISQRDEAFLDLSVDLDEHSSVTACLRKFSEEEMLCERNKFHCDGCGGLQEAEKRMKIKRLPKILALHLKRFKYTEDLQRLQKLFHRVVYPYHLRLFNTTDDAEDPDRLYELYAVVVHIGGGPYHGHYISIVKTEDRGWLLFDDEMVEPVDRSYVQNFFGDRPGLACAYVLFYQETTLDAVRQEQDAESLAAESHAIVQVPKEPVGLGLKTNGFMNGIHHVKSAVSPTSEDANGYDNLDKAVTEPPPAPTAVQSPVEVTALPQYPTPATSNEDSKSKKERAKEEKERKALEKISARQEEKAERERRKNLEIKRKEMIKKTEADTKAAIEASRVSKAEEDQKGTTENAPKDSNLTGSGGLSRFKSSSKSFRRPRLFTKEAAKEEPLLNGNADGIASTDVSDRPVDKSRHRFSSLRKRSSNMKLL